VKKGVEVSNVEVSLLATKISARDHIAYSKALSLASKELGLDIKSK